MYKKLKRFLVGDPSPRHRNKVYFQTTPPDPRGGLFRVPQLRKADLWFDSSTTPVTSYRWNGKNWVELPVV